MIGNVLKDKKVAVGAIFVPDEKQYIIDDDLITARSAANLTEFFNAIVEQTANRE